MRVFVATDRTQGKFPGDCCAVPEGELLVEPSTGGPYLVGAECFRATTTFEVRELDMAPEQYAAAVLECRRRQLGGLLTPANEAGIAEECFDEARDLAAAAAAFEPGSVVGARATRYFLREGPPESR